MPAPSSWSQLAGNMPPPIIGPQCEHLRELIPALVKSRKHLIVTGEEGVGKSLFASHLRAAGCAAERGFTVNCITSSDRDQRLALFGSEYVSLTTTRRSVLELPATIIVKHINRAPCEIQEELGRTLGGGHVMRPGSLSPVEVRARVILTFRESPDILAKHSLIAPSLAGAIKSFSTVHIPPLRDRNEDCLAIARDVLGFRVSPRLRRTLLGYSWPRNVAELKAYLALSRPLPLAGSHRAECFRDVSRLFVRIEEGGEISLPSEIASIQSSIVRYALRHAGSHRGRAAQILGITEHALRWHMSRMKDHA